MASGPADCCLRQRTGSELWCFFSEWLLPALPGFTVDEVTEETYAVGVRQAQEVQDWTMSQLNLVGFWCAKN